MSSKFQAKIKKRKEQDFESMFGSPLDDELLDDDFLTSDEVASKDLVYHDTEKILDPAELSFQNNDFLEPPTTDFFDGVSDHSSNSSERICEDDIVYKEGNGTNVEMAIEVDIPPGASIRPPTKKKFETEGEYVEESVYKKTKNITKKSSSKEKEVVKSTKEKPVLSATGIGSYFYLTVEVKNALKLRHILEPERTMSEHVEAALRIYLENELMMLGDGK